MDSTAQIELKAAAWLTKRDSGEWTGEDASALESWLDTATANRIAFLRLEAAWEESLRLKALAAGFPADAGKKTGWKLLLPLQQDRPISQEHTRGDTETFFEVAPRATVSQKSSRQKFLALAASVLVAVGAAYYFGNKVLQHDRYTTPVGGMASVPLQDGSNVLLNTASAIRVALNAQERRIDLAEGEAFFDVAKDPARPFVVMAGKKQIVAVGTKFSVRREAERLRVVVTEGRVRIEDSGRSASVGSDEEVLVAAGGVARAEPSGVLVQKRTVAETEALLSWRTGYLTFLDTPLGDAVAEFNQYSKRRIVVADPKIATIPLTGKIKAANYEAFVWLLQDGYSIDVHREEGTIVLTGKKTADQ